METDSWDRLSAASKRWHSILGSQFEVCLGFEEIDALEDNYRSEFPCPFCAEDFDLVGLCGHLDDEHLLDVNNGAVCPVCSTWVAEDVLGHIKMQHGNIFKMKHERRFLRGSHGSHSTLPFGRKDLHDDNFFYGGSSDTVASSNTAPDPLLSAFIFNIPLTDPGKDVKPIHSDDGITVDETEISYEELVESAEPPLSVSDEERAQKSEFVRELVLSTIFDDIL